MLNNNLFEKVMGGKSMANITKGIGLNNQIQSDKSRLLNINIPDVSFIPQMAAAITSDDPYAKKAGIATGAVQGVSTIANQFGAPGKIVGQAINLIDNIGGALVPTPKAFKKFNLNQNIGSGFGGVTEQANSIKGGVDTYNSSGLTGKLSLRRGLKRDIEKNNQLQSQASDLTSMNKKAIDAATNSSYMNDINVASKFLKNGGDINKSIIADGALHEEKHDIKDTESFKDKQITSHGIPVVEISDDGKDVFQHAEIEHNELVLRTEVSKVLTELMSSKAKDKIKAGKILAYELMKNTIDNSDKLLE